MSSDQLNRLISGLVASGAINLDDFATAGAEDDTVAGDDPLQALLAFSGADDDTAAGDIIGDIIGDIVGARMGMRGRQNFGRGRQNLGRGRQNGNAALQAFARQAAAARQQGPNRRVLDYTPPQYSRARDIPMGFDSGVAVPAGGTVNITQRPQIPFRPARLTIPSDIAGSFLVNDMKVGNKSQLAANSALPGRMFQENAVGNNLLLDTASPAIDVVLSVTNISGGAVRFNAGIVGPAVEELPHNPRTIHHSPASRPSHALQGNFRLRSVSRGIRARTQQPCSADHAECAVRRRYALPPRLPQHAALV